MKKSRILSGFLTVGFWTLTSRILGLLREILLLSLIGPGPILDAFLAAFRLPNMFRRFFAEGAFNAAFVPMFTKRLNANDAPADFASAALNALAFCTLIMTAIAMIFMPGLVWITVEGFAADARFNLTVGFGRILFPYIFFMSLSALFSGVLNATGRFAIAAAAPVLLNIFMIAAMSIAYAFGHDVITLLIWIIPVAGIAQLALTWGAAAHAGFALKPGLPRFTPELRALLVTAVPTALATGVMQINLVVGQLVASPFEGAVSWLFAADRLYQLPLGVVGIAVGIVLLPDLSRRLVAQDDEGARNALSRATEFSMAITIPAAVALCIIPLELVSVMYGRGETGPDDVIAIAGATFVYALGLPAFVLQKLQQPLYFARSDTRRPFYFALVSMLLNAVIAFGSMAYLGWLAPALATTVSAWAMFALLWWGTRDMGPVARFDSRFHQRLPRIILSSLIMGGILLLMARLLGPAFSIPGFRYVALLVLVGSGIVSFFFFAHLTHGLRLNELRGSMQGQKR